MVTAVVLDIMLAIIGFVVLAAQSKTLSRKLGMANIAAAQESIKDNDSGQDLAMYGPEEEEDPPFGFVGMQRNSRQMAKSTAKFVIIPPAVPKQNKKRTQLMRLSQLAGRT